MNLPRVDGLRDWGGLLGHRRLGHYPACGSGSLMATEPPSIRRRRAPEDERSPRRAAPTSGSPPNGTVGSCSRRPAGRSRRSRGSGGAAPAVSPAGSGSTGRSARPSSAAWTGRSTARPPLARPSGCSTTRPRSASGTRSWRARRPSSWSSGSRRRPRCGRRSPARGSGCSRTSAAGSAAARRLDTALERVVADVLRRPARERRPIYAGAVSRLLALAIDAGVVYGSLLVISAAIALLISIFAVGRSERRHRGARPRASSSGR